MVERKKCSVSNEEVTRVKGLGFLRDKTTEDCFHCRVITGNGKIGMREMIAINEAARRFGSGEIALTVRQTIEIQKIPYKHIDDVVEFLKEQGVSTGGTGKKVRPIVSCKGTTCQFGRIDTYSLSEKIHKRFYEEMRDRVLPHKFKITVGGCPNNCVKPGLNDVGIIGDVVNGNPAYRVFVGGRFGKTMTMGQELSKKYTSEEEVLDKIEDIIAYFEKNGEQGERFAETIIRIGFERVDKELA